MINIEQFLRLCFPVSFLIIVLVFCFMLVKKEYETSKAFGKNPFERSMNDLLMNGIIILDKPSGPSSHVCMSYIKRILKIDKAGHSGTLDHIVTGVLVVGLSKATRIVPYLLKAPKEYICLMRLHADYSEEEIRRAINSFIGVKEQRVPKRSAVKRQIRQRSVYDINILEIKDRYVLFTARVQAGTYIRMLCFDIGKKLGSGANMQELRRIKVADLSEDCSVTLDELKMAYNEYKEKNDDSYLRKCIFPVEIALTHLKRIYILDSAVSSVCHGAPLKVPGISRFDENIKAGEFVRILSLKNELIGVGVAKLSSEDILKSNSGFAVKLDTIIMDRDVYPKIWK